MSPGSAGAEPGGGSLHRDEGAALDGARTTFAVGLDGRLDELHALPARVHRDAARGLHDAPDVGGPDGADAVVEGAEGEGAVVHGWCSLVRR